MVKNFIAERTTSSPEQTFFQQIYSWMSLALIITGGVSYVVSSSPTLIRLLMANQLLFFVIIMAELGLVVWLVSSLQKLSFNQALTMFVVYSTLNGVTLSGLTLMYTGTSVFLAFFITAATFIFMSTYASKTKADLTELGKLCFMGLIGIIIASLINIFFRSELIYWIISYVGVVVFIGLIAYDTQKLKLLYSQHAGDQQSINKLALYGALTLYLDFINLFIMILRIVGVRRD